MQAKIPEVFHVQTSKKSKKKGIYTYKNEKSLLLFCQARGF
jgi:hypothetical protein